jgi:hypothetical protein
MRISRPVKQKAASGARVAATVTWEQAARPPVEIFFEVGERYAESLSSAANAFLVAALFPAAEAGEQRVLVEGEVCPRLLCGLRANLHLLRLWYRHLAAVPAIEAPVVAAQSRDVPSARAGVFFTGGIDSLATLCRNRAMFPSTHPDAFRDAVMLYGMNFDSDDSPETFRRAVEELTPVARAADTELVPVYSNARPALNPDIEFFRLRYHGALLASCAHALSGRLSSMTIAASHDLTHLIPWGSHPVLDVNFSSSSMHIHHDAVELTRYQKTTLIADWEPGLQNIRVCVTNWPGENCGRCEKCLRTMLALTACGAAERSHSFGGHRVSADSVAGILLFNDSQASFYRELPAPLRAAGRDDLAASVEFILRRYRGELGVRGLVKLIDQRWLGGGLAAFMRSLRDADPRNPGVITRGNPA